MLWFYFSRNNKDNQKLIGYLVDQRKIDPSVVSHFIQDNSLYQSKVTTQKGATFSNIAFVCKNFDGAAAGAIKRGFPVKDRAGFKGNAEGSDIGNYGFSKDGQGSLFVFEAPVDMMSYMSMIANPNPNAENFGKDAASANLANTLGFGYLATGGTHISSLINYLNHEANQGRYQKIYLCHDNDTAGLDARLTAMAALEKQGIDAEIICHFPSGKDWNEDLTNNDRSKDVVKGSTAEIVEAINKRQKDFFQQKNQKMEEVKLQQDSKDYVAKQSHPSNALKRA